VDGDRWHVIPLRQVARRKRTYQSAAHALGIKAVSTYQQDDRVSLHRMKADEACLVGEGRGPVT
jgi:pyruvate carboxylase